MAAMAEDRIAVYRDQPIAEDTFKHLRYMVKRPLWQLWDRRHDIYTPDGGLAMRSFSPVFKLRDELTIYADAAKTRPLLFLKQRKVIQLSTEWDVTDSVTGEAMGTLRRRFAKSLFRDHWDIIGTDGRERGQVIERGHSLIRRFFPLLPSKHDIEIGGRVVAHIVQKFRWFTKEFHLDLTPAVGAIDTRFAIACTILVLAAEAQRENSN
jgi:hypothetical protein